MEKTVNQKTSPLWRGLEHRNRNGVHVYLRGIPAACVRCHDEGPAAVESPGDGDSVGETEPDCSQVCSGLLRVQADPERG